MKKTDLGNTRLSKITSFCVPARSRRSVKLALELIQYSVCIVCIVGSTQSQAASNSASSCVIEPTAVSHKHTKDGIVSQHTNSVDV